MVWTNKTILLHSLATNNKATGGKAPLVIGSGTLVTHNEIPTIPTDQAMLLMLEVILKFERVLLSTTRFFFVF